MPTYRLDRSWEWNYRNGPAYRGPFPRVPPTPLKEFFGVPVRSRIGISAGLLLNSRWIELYARLGFDVLTYKTVRSAARASYPPPNWLFLRQGEAVDPRRPDQVLHARRGRPADLSRAAATVSFGMPSQPPEVWTRDVARARALLPRGKALVVSVVASPGEPVTATAGGARGGLIADFARLAELASESGAQIVEANLSCPNVSTPEGCVYFDPQLSRRVMAEMRRAASGIPLLAKASTFPGRRPLRAFLRAMDGLAEGVVLLNAISRRVVGARGRPAFGPGREVSGVIGRAIAALSLRSVRDAAAIIREDRLSLRIVAVGGVLAPEDAAPYFEAGAYGLALGGAPLYDPRLAVRMKREHPEW